MEKVQIKGKSVIISLNPRLYNKHAIEQTIKDYGSVCRFEDDNGHITLKDIDPSIDIRIIGYEFCNYALSLMKK